MNQGHNLATSSLSFVRAHPIAVATTVVALVALCAIRTILKNRAAKKQELQKTEAQPEARALVSNNMKTLSWLQTLPSLPKNASIGTLITIDLSEIIGLDTKTNTIVYANPNEFADKAKVLFFNRTTNELYCIKLSPTKEALYIQRAAWFDNLPKGNIQAKPEGAISVKVEDVIGFNKNTNTVYVADKKGTGIQYKAEIYNNASQYLYCTDIEKNLLAQNVKAKLALRAEKEALLKKVPRGNLKAKPEGAISVKVEDIIAFAKRTNIVSIRENKIVTQYEAKVYNNASQLLYCTKIERKPAETAKPSVNNSPRKTLFADSPVSSNGTGKSSEGSSKGRKLVPVEEVIVNKNGTRSIKGDSNEYVLKAECTF